MSDKHFKSLWTDIGWISYPTERVGLLTLPCLMTGVLFNTITSYLCSINKSDLYSLIGYKVFIHMPIIILDTLINSSNLSEEYLSVRERS
jgi:hypothetical protein